MLNIELLNHQKMVLSGSSLIKMIQNNSLPVLDLFVRESIQNSLDAHLDNTDFITVDMIYDKFDNEKFIHQFESIDSTLQKKKLDCHYLAIKDCYTTGLVGGLDGLTSGVGQNLNNLVFNIMKAQQTEGAGGAWGIGKTVFFRLGIGMVIYYSRIKKGASYEERLVASLVEDETKNNRILSDYKDNIGLAFFGDQKPDGTVKACTKIKEIEEMLSCFGIDRYKGTQTGTTVIIPYVYDKEVLNNNKIHEENTWWETSIEEYLKVSILRWYFPRMSQNYKYGPRLVPLVNHMPINIDDNELVFFKKLSELYDICLTNSISDKRIKRVSFERNGLVEKSIGAFSFVEVTYDELIGEHHLPNPYLYSLIYYDDSINNLPIVCFTRKPGMIINYEVRNYPKIDSDKFVIGIFTLNSDNSFDRDGKYNLDEYVRQGEKSDHASWSDHSFEGLKKNVHIIRNINNQINNTLEKEYGEVKHSSGDGEIDYGLSKLFARLLLPDNNYGNALGGVATGKEGKSKTGNKIIKTRKNQFQYIGIEYGINRIILKYSVNINKNTPSIMIQNKINTLNNALTAIEYEETGMIFPCEIEQASIAFKYIDDQLHKDEYLIVDNKSEKTTPYYSVSLLTLSNGIIYGFELSPKTKFSKAEFVLSIEISTKDKMISPILDCSFGGK